jgi:hypothetical protein
MKQKMMDIQKFSFTGWCPKMAHTSAGIFSAELETTKINNMNKTNWREEKLKYTRCSALNIPAVSTRLFYALQAVCDNRTAHALVKKK